MLEYALSQAHCWHESLAIILYADQGKLAEAEAMYKRASEGYEKAHGVNYPSTLLRLANKLLLLDTSQTEHTEVKVIHSLGLYRSDEAHDNESAFTIASVNS